MIIDQLPQEFFDNKISEYIARAVITRFAPSPTGQLHLGHAYAAMFAYEMAIKGAGEFLIRYEDIDSTRVRSEYYQAIEDDLAALGLTWKIPVIRQSDRLAAYQKALTELQRLGVVYPCFCNRRDIMDEVNNMENAPHSPEGVIYPGICRDLPSSEVQQRLAAGEPHCWRLHSEKAIQQTGELSFQDSFHGEIAVRHDLLGDVVLARKDIATSYHLAVVVDDDYQSVTDITRGEDLLPSTHVHRILQKLFNMSEPAYHHHPLVLDNEGVRLAKRHDALSVRSLLDSGKTVTEIKGLLPFSLT